MIFLVLKPLKSTHKLAMIKLKPPNIDHEEEEEKAHSKKGVVRKNIVKVWLDPGWDYKVKMMGFQKKIRDIAVTLRFVFVALSDGVASVDFKQWQVLDTYDIEAHQLHKNDTHVFGLDFKSQIVAECETFGALDGKHQAGLIYKDKAVDIEVSKMCVNNHIAIAVFKDREENEWEMLKLELFTETQIFQRPKMDVSFMCASVDMIFTCGNSNQVLCMDLNHDFEVVNAEEGTINIRTHDMSNLSQRHMINSKYTVLETDVKEII